MNLTNIIIRRIELRIGRLPMNERHTAHRAIAALRTRDWNREAFANSEAMQDGFAQDLNALTKALSAA